MQVRLALSSPSAVPQRAEGGSGWMDLFGLYSRAAYGIAANTSDAAVAGSTFTHTLATLPLGSIRKVLRLAMTMPAKPPSDPYSLTTLWSVSESRWNVSPSLVQNCLWLSAESTLTPRITAFLASNWLSAFWKLCASMVQPGVMSLG